MGDKSRAPAPPTPVKVTVATSTCDDVADGGTVVVGDSGRSRPTSAATSPNTWRGLIAAAAPRAVRAYAISFAMRAALALVMFTVRSMRSSRRRGGPVSASTALALPQSFRFANMVGSFALVWRLIGGSLVLAERDPTSAVPVFLRQVLARKGAIPFVAGTLAGLSVLFETYENRLTVMQQFGVRAAQAVCNVLSARNLINFTHGDTLAFSFACASIMYAYVMAPDTIPKEYNNWIIKTGEVTFDDIRQKFVQTGRVTTQSLAISRQNVRAQEFSSTVPAVSIDEMYDCINKYGRSNTLTALQSLSDYYDKNVDSSGTLPIVPCAVIHPAESNCTKYNTILFFKILGDIAPVYAALNFVPLVFLHPQKILANPRSTLVKTLLRTAVSSLFLGVYVGVYMIGICIVRYMVCRNVIRRDWKGFYYILGGLASACAVLVEEKKRRIELAMYVLPKGLQSLFLVMQKRKWVKSFPGAETITCCLSMGVLMVGAVSLNLFL
ncbi:hypothetical protein HDU83_009166 [Entophlyctis luteolus]|nr:hypothetical protein HDU83_009166 [Entophlyctis luteolus]KAJ3394294.1 hypothetical protein HDU84_009049 [Entophlyctis sp. JEL0112]